jgi:polyisoprenoid-binding protein YceI
MRGTIFSVMMSGLFLILSAAEYHVDTSGDNLVKFISDAPIEDFEGITSNIDGYLYWEGDSLTHNSELYFEVDLNTLDTGIGLRNRHMRDNYLETEKYPRTWFRAEIVAVDSVSENEMRLRAKGTMFIHGVEREKEIEGTLNRQDGRLQIQAQFEVKLSDYNIKIPSIMFYKIDEVMALEVSFFMNMAGE